MKVPGLSSETARARDLAFWQRLHVAGLVADPMMPDPREQTPWFLRAIAGIAAWLAAVLLAVAVGFLLFDQVTDLGGTGFAILGASVALAAAAGLRGASGTFATQGLISLSLAGQLLVASAVMFYYDHDTPMFFIGGVVQGGLAIVLHCLNRVALHRFICGVAMAFGLYFITSSKPMFEGIGTGSMMVISVLLPVALNTAALLLWAVARPMGAHPGLAPLTWAFTLSATVVSLSGAYYSDAGRVAWAGFMSMSLLPGLFAVALVWPTRRIVGTHLALLLPLVMLMMSPVWMRMPGVGLALAWVIGGFALARPLLLGFGIACLPVYLLRYVYMMNLTLLEKSGWLTGTGLVLLLLWGAWQAVIDHRARQAVAAGAIRPSESTT